MNAGVTGHQRGIRYLHVTDGKCAQKVLTIGVNLNLERLQESIRLNAHEVGRALTSLGLTNREAFERGIYSLP
jgi:hypothetical protein